MEQEDMLADSTKKIYYVNVQSKQLYMESDIAPYHVVIIANDHEYDDVMIQLSELDTKDEQILDWSVVHLRNNSEDMSEVNKEYDIQIKQLYQTLYKLGTDETRKHIEQMQIL